MAKFTCPTCGRGAESEGGCFLHKKRKALSHNSKLKPKAASMENVQEHLREVEKMRAFMDYLWHKLPAKKYCWSCKQPIWGENLTIYWDHLLEKHLFPELKFEEENMFFCCGDCHAMKSSGFPREIHRIAIEKAKQKFGVL